MKTSLLIQWLTYAVWGIMSFDLLLVFIIPVEIDANNWEWIIVFIAWEFLSLWFSVTWLIIFYRSFFSSFLGWMTPVVCLVSTNFWVGGGSPIQNARVDMLISLAFVTSIWAVGVTTALYLWHHDHGIQLCGIFLLLFMWTLVFLYRAHGNLMETMLLNIIRSDVPSPLGWLNPFFCILGWLIPLGIVSFLIHTIRLFASEL